MSNEVPEILKTWEWDPNHIIQADATIVSATQQDRQNLMFQIKESLTNGISSNFTVPWTVHQSSDGTTADATDNWDVAADLVWGTDSSDPNTSTRSWIVLHNSALGVYLTLDLTGTSTERGSEIDAWISSFAPNIDGTTTSRPTAGGAELQVADRTVSNWGAWEGNASNSSARAYILHVMMSDDGEETRVIINTSSTCTALWVIGKHQGPLVAPTHDWFICLTPKDRDGQSAPTVVNWNEDDNADFRWFAMKNDGGFVDARIRASRTDPGVDAWGDLYGNAANAYDGRRSIQEFVLESETAGWSMTMGRVADMWWGPILAGSNGKTWPDTREFIQAGEVLLPWDGSTIPIP